MRLTLPLLTAAMSSTLASDVKLSGYNEKQVLSASSALLKFVGDKQSKGNTLFDEDDVINLNISLKTMPLQVIKTLIMTYFSSEDDGILHAVT